jgi:putative flippase GtrA
MRSRLAQQSLRYVVTGLTSALFEYLLFLGCYELLQIPAVVSNVVALLAATALNFGMNRLWAFKSSSSLTGSMVKYGILFTFNLIVSTLAVAWFIALGFPAALVKLITMICVASWNFVLYRKVVFK